MTAQQPLTTYLNDYQPADYHLHTMDLIVELGETVTKVKSQLHLNANDHDGQLPLVLNGRELQLQAISLNGQLLSNEDYQLDEEYLTIHHPGKNFQLDIEVHIKPQENTSLEGLYKSSGDFCSQCEAQGFRKITYFIDRPDNLAIFTTTIIADKDHYPVLLSNGNLVDAGESSDNRHWVKWHDPFKKAGHLFALVAGKLVCLQDRFITQSGREITLKLFVEPGNLAKCALAMKSLQQAMRWDEQCYGREYDLDIFMTVAVADFNMGAMENKGLNIFNTACVLANPQTETDADFARVQGVVAHEYFHNWSGNRVGCRDWFQLSLKEGFTVFRDQTFSADMTSPAVKRIADINFLRNMQFKEDAGPMSHPVRPSSYIEINNFYTLTIYEKGAEIIRMLHTLLGAEKFRQATDVYFSRFDSNTATTDDFVDVMQEVSGLDLSQFTLWYSQAGTPVLQVTDEYNSKSKTYTLTITQHTPATPGQNEKHPLHIPLKLALLDQSGHELSTQLLGDHHQAKIVHVLDVTAQQQKFVFIDVPYKPIPSLLRGLSAPVKLNYPYTDQQLKTLLMHDNDDFVRWEAGQLLAIGQLQVLILAVQQQQTLLVDNAFINIFKNLLTNESLDKNFLALLLTLPSESYLAELMEC
ncbi:MAG: aminopeptidase N, partial [Gammaproteobacteria bacterium]|nr:aminopeptidase N [Gammaproteobacteria bacterium]